MNYTINLKNKFRAPAEIKTIHIGKKLEELKIRNFVDIKNSVECKDELMTEILFPRYTDAAKAIDYFEQNKIANSGRQSHKHVNAYYKFKIEIYIKW